MQIFGINYTDYQNNNNNNDNNNNNNNNNNNTTTTNNNNNIIITRLISIIIQIFEMNSKFLNVSQLTVADNQFPIDNNNFKNQA